MKRVTDRQYSGPRARHNRRGHYLKAASAGHAVLRHGVTPYGERLTQGVVQPGLVNVRASAPIMIPPRRGPYD